MEGNTYKETKGQKFTRMMAVRKMAAVKAIKLIDSMADPSGFEFSREGINKHLGQIRTALNNASNSYDMALEVIESRRD